jgi:phospholipase A1/A2
MVRHFLLAGFLLVFFCGIPGYPAVAATAGSMDGCAKIDDDAARLRCYDEAAGRKPKEAPARTTPAPPAPGQPAKYSYLSWKWQLDEESRRNRYAIMPYRANYLLPYTYNFTQNKQLYQAIDPNIEIQDAEAKFQLSFKIKLWESILGTDTDLWVGYTQLSLWQVYNSAFSAPFRETNYEPEILLSFRTNTDIFGLVRNRFIQIGLNHQSNGRSEPLSRSWNRVVANFGFERDSFNMVLRTWMRIPESAENDDNRDIESYLGYGELVMGYFWKDFAVAATFRNNLRLNSDNVSGLQLDFTFPLFDPINGYVQYFVGYGESLIDYNHYNNRIGVGFLVKDW